jgi:hypothetical protein
MEYMEAKMQDQLEASMNEYETMAARIAELEELHKGCICHGNWRNIVADCQDQLGQSFNDDKGEVYNFFGVVLSEDDYYYGMFRKGQLRLLSCVGSLESHGFTPVLIPNADGLQPCCSPYCECEKNKCTHPGFYDDRDRTS